MKLVVAIAAGIVAALAAAPAFAQEAPGTLPFPAKKAEVLLHIDTVTASPGESKYGVSYSKRCTVTNLYRRGEGAVFRVWGVNARTGEALTPENVKYLYLKVPGQPNLNFRFTPHGRDPDSPWFWANRWDIPLDYPLGQVDYQVVVKLKTWGANKIASFGQPKIFGAAQLGWMEILETRPAQ